MRPLKTLRNRLRLFSLIVVLVAGWVGAAEKNPQSVQVRIRTILAGNKSDWRRRNIKIIVSLSKCD